MANLSQSDVVSDAKLALQVGEILCEALYRDLTQQNPVSAVDKGSYWRAEGSRNRDGAINGVAEFFLSIEKSNGRVTDIGEYLRCPPHPSIIPMINEHFARNGATQPPEATITDDSDEKRGAGILILTGM